MAKNDIKDITNISAVISQMGINSERTIKQFEQAISSGQKLNKEMQRLAKEGYAKLNEELRRNQAMQRQYLKNLYNLTGEEVRKYKILQQNEAQMLRGIASLGQIIRSTEEAKKKIVQFNQSLVGSTLSLGRFSIAGTGAFGAILGAAQLAVNAIIGLYNVWFERQQSIIRSFGELAQATGASAQQLQDLNNISESMRQTFSDLGGSITGVAEAASFTQEFALSMRDANFETEQMARDINEIGRGFGVGTPAAVELFRVLQSGAMGSSESLDEFGADMSAFAESIGAHAGQLTADFIASRDAIVEFGRDSQEVYRHSAELAQAFGFEVRQIYQVSSQFNTFQNASEGANQLNAILGTTISSYELMQLSNTDAAGAVEYLRTQINDAGVSWDDMDAATHRALSTQLGLTESETAQLLRQDITLDELRAQQQRAADSEAAQARARMTAEEQMQQLLQATSTAFRSVGDRMEQIYLQLADVLAPAFEAFHEETDAIVVDFRNWLDEMNRTGQTQTIIHDMSTSIHGIGEAIRTVTHDIEVMTFALHVVEEVLTTIQDAFGFFFTGIGGMYDFATGTERGTHVFGRTLDEMAEAQQALVQEHEAITHPQSRGIQEAASTGPSVLSTVMEPVIRGMLSTQTPEQVAETLRTRLDAPTIAQLEGERGQTLDSYVSSLESDNSSAATPTSSVESATSAAHTAPVTERTAAARTSSAGVTVLPVVATANVTLDGRQVGTAIYQISQMA